MSNHLRLLATVCLIIAATTSIVIATNKETDVPELTSLLQSLDDSPESSAFPSNVSIGRSLNLADLVDPPPIQQTRFPSGVPCGTRRVRCNCPNSPYRTIDGTCNNLLFPARGSAGFPMSRLQKGRYASSSGRIITNGLPLARVVSLVLFTDRDVPDRRVTNNINTWGQATAHDSGFIIPRRGSDGRPLQCCSPDGQMLSRIHRNCSPIELPPDDPFYAQFRRRCMDMVRSEILDQSACSENEFLQVSIATHFQDMSFTYGNSNREMRELRTFTGGELKAKILSSSDGPQMFMPNEDNPRQSCFVTSSRAPCYKAGDSRVNENVGLAALQTLMLREHNRIARELNKMHPDWNDETLFQEARRINIAEWQYITWDEYLPKIIGKKLMEKLNLIVPETGFSGEYLNRADPSTMNEHTTAAFRFPHSLVQGTFEFTDEKRCPLSSLRLRDSYMQPGTIEKRDNLNSIFRGTSTQACQSADRHFTQDITRFLLRNRLPFGDDLESFDVQRGRDHGLPSYNDLRVHCGLKRAKVFEDFLDVMSERDMRRLRSLYRNPEDVEGFVGGTLEVPGVLGDDDALVGHTFGCIIGEQFWRWKFADRYFFDFSGQAGSFTLQQINGIKKTSLSAMMCENLSIKNIQEDAFLQVGPGNELKDCADIEKMDLKGWENYTPPPDSCSPIPA